MDSFTQFAGTLLSTVNANLGESFNARLKKSHVNDGSLKIELSIEKYSTKSETIYNVNDIFKNFGESRIADAALAVVKDCKKHMR